VPVDLLHDAPCIVREWKDHRVSGVFNEGVGDVQTTREREIILTELAPPTLEQIARAYSDGYRWKLPRQNAVKPTRYASNSWQT
jgi:hypothetical protein